MTKTTDIRVIKNSLRDSFKAIRREMPALQKDEKDSGILKRFVKLPEYEKSETVVTFVSTEIEVDTITLIKKALQDGKRVAVPRCIDGTRQMQFYYVTSLDDLEIGAFRVLEPKTNICEPVYENVFSSSICVVPGLGFDENGYRLGYGKGYYDRFLSKYSDFTVGVCYNSCVKYKLPSGKFDRAVDLLITDQYYIRFNK